MESAIPPRLSIRAAAKWANVSERTLRRMVSDGRISIVEEKNGKKLLEMCDLDRLGLLGIKGETSKAPPPRQERVTDELTALRHQVEALRQQVGSLTRERDRARVLPRPGARRVTERREPPGGGGSETTEWQK